MTGGQEPSKPGVRAAAVAGDVMVECHGARVRAHARSRATVAVVSGQIDACNADWLREMLRRCAVVSTALVLDMSGVDFLAVQGLNALLALDDECREAGVEWALIASPAVYRVVGVGGREDSLPVVSSLAEALQRPTCARTLLRLVSSSDAAGHPASQRAATLNVAEAPLVGDREPPREADNPAGS
jgi:anti-anti-sigma factor